tara:strand:+ start:4597 stop:5850 length:1254 start_codon:yes stop_codon:yes gene_type:complete
MTSWIKLAFRNLARNKRRSVVTILAATLGFAAVNLFGGFTTYMFVNLRDAFIYAGGNGHLQVCKKGYHQHGATDPANYLLSAETYQKLRKLAEEDDRIILAAGKLDVSGQIDSGNASNIFIGRAVTPSEHEEFFKHSKTLKRGFSFLAKGEKITDDNPYAIGVAFGVEETLGLNLEDEVVLMARTLDGQLNVVDAAVKHVFGNASANLADKLIFMPLQLAQELYQTDGVGTVGILLNHQGDLDSVREKIEAVLADAPEELEITPWDQQSEMYKLTRKMFNMIFGIVFIILIVIVTMSVMNTMGMAILERTTEIGTLRALGLKQVGVIFLFGIEGALLGVLGSITGMIATIAVWLLVKIQQPMWTPPTIAREVPLEIRLEPSYLLITTVFLVVLTLAAAIIPARKASKTGIVEALGHV